MKYLVKSPYGISYNYNLDQIREGFKAGTLPENCKVREDGTQEWQTLRQLLESTGDYTPPTPPPPETPASIAGKLRRRYSDAYNEAHAVVTVGKVVKAIGALLFIGILVAAFAMSSDRSGGGQTLVIGIIVACVVGIPVYVLGILVAAQGQTQLATLDTAVNSSRHLKDDDVAAILTHQFSL